MGLWNTKKIHQSLSHLCTTFNILIKEYYELDDVRTTNKKYMLEIFRIIIRSITLVFKQVNTTP